MPIDSADIELGGLAGPARSFVDPDEVVAFALAINDHNPRYLDGTVARLAARFSAPAFPGDDIELAVYEIGGTADRGTAFAFEAHSGGATVLRHGRLEIRGGSA